MTDDTPTRVGYSIDVIIKDIYVTNKLSVERYSDSVKPVRSIRYKGLLIKVSGLLSPDLLFGALSSTFEGRERRRRDVLNGS